MSATSAVRAGATHAPTERPSTLLVYRDDGPLARALGAAVAPAVRRIPAVLFVVAGVIPMLVAIIADGDGASRGLAAATLAWLVVVGGLSHTASHTDRMAWAVPPVVRMGEYVAILWIATLDGGSGPAAFALLCAFAFRAYDLVYRLRHQATTPAGWVNAISLGWEGRVILAFVLLVVGALPAGYFVWAGLVAIVFVGEATRSWMAHARGQRVADYEDEEDEGQ
jgi:Family of unknown function (DUF5941)